MKDLLPTVLATLIAGGIAWVGLGLTQLQTQTARIEERIVSVQTGMAGHDRRIEKLEEDVAAIKLQVTPK